MEPDSGPTSQLVDTLVGYGMTISLCAFFLIILFLYFTVGGASAPSAEKDEDEDKEGD